MGHVNWVSQPITQTHRLQHSCHKTKSYSTRAWLFSHARVLLLAIRWLPRKNGGMTWEPSAKTRSDRTSTCRYTLQWLIQGRRPRE
jgi:hypothetical protein